MKANSYQLLFKRLKNGDEKAFEILFRTFYGSLCRYALQFVNEEEEAEEITQEFFIKLWEKRTSLEIDTSVTNYLFRSVKNQCLNFIQHNKVKKKYVDNAKDFLKQNNDESQFYLEPGLAEKIEYTINLMPRKRRQIFMLSREKGLTYKEIAAELNISIKTVEAQMGHALKFLRNKLRDFNPDLILFYFFIRQK